MPGGEASRSLAAAYFATCQATPQQQSGRPFLTQAKPTRAEHASASVAMAGREEDLCYPRALRARETALLAVQRGAAGLAGEELKRLPIGGGFRSATFALGVL